PAYPLAAGYDLGSEVAMLASNESCFGPSEGVIAAAQRALAGTPVDLDWYTTRERGYDEILPWDHLDSGLDADWLWDDWQDALAGREQDDCRWTPCFDCGVCPSLGTDIQVGATHVGPIDIGPIHIGRG
ncbi:MAG: hypothetical protein ACRDQX_01435, partial [Pseudonocardiaceae bacterium]